MKHLRDAADTRGRTHRARLRPLAIAVAALALALPATAAAHPGVYVVTPKTAPSGCTFAAHPDGSCLEDGKVQYTVSNDGWAMGFTESNGVEGITGEGTAGLINYKLMPTAFRQSMTPEDRLAYAPAQTGLQAHATCSGVSALSDRANIVAWQEREDNDVFFNYIPWQKTSAGLGDEPSKWIPVVEQVTGVDLTSLSEEAEFVSACTGLGGSYHKADTASSIDKATAALKVEEAVLPLEAQIASLGGEKSSLQSQIDAWKAKGDGLEGERSALLSAQSKLQGESAQLRKQLQRAKHSVAKQAKTIARLRTQLRRAAQHG